MKFRNGMLVAGALAAGNVYAQSSVTLYGVMDTSIRFTTNQATANGPKDLVAMTNGGLASPRWGLRGTEDLGAGNKAIFALESGFSADTGGAQAGVLFGRQSWVGLSNERYGTLKVGRQYGAAYWAMANVDPIYTGSYTEIGFEYFITGLRYDNTIDYSNKWGGLFVNAQYSLGEQAGNGSRGRTMQFGTTYETGGLMLAAGAQQSKDANGKDLTYWLTGARYNFGDLSVHGYYLDSRRDAGFIVGASGTTAPLANTSLISNANTIAGPNTQTSERHDRMGVFGVAYQRNGSPWRFVATYMRDNAAGVSRGASGIIQTGYFIADYSLSKRTDVYFEVDRSWLSGASVTDPNSPIGSFGGASTRTGAAIGLRTRF